VSDGRHKLERRILLVAPTPKDASLTTSILAAEGLTCISFADTHRLARELRSGAGCLLLAEETLTPEDEDLLAALAEQPPWSDLPVLILTYRGADSPVVAGAVEKLGNVTLLERPTRVATLLSAVRAALRARQRQYEMRAYLIERERSAEALREADRRKDEFLAMLAHELRNPLAPISNSLDLLRMIGHEPGVLVRVHEVMERQVAHLVRLVDDLLELSRITRGRIELRLETVVLADAIHSAVETSRPLIEAGGHSLTIALPAEPLLMHADPVRLAQVFANLLNNAARYTPEPGHIRISARRNGGEVVVSVRDTGIGIPSQMIPYVFEMFARGAAGSRVGGGGLGIGLTLVRSLVAMHGGRVAVHSDGAGRGSEFVVRLPLTRHGAAKPSGVAQPPAPAPASAHRVLVVDDSRDAAESLAMLLSYLGANVRVAHDGPAALSALEQHRPDAVLLDIGMPEMDGYEVARRIRRHRDFSTVPVIALSGWGQEEDRRRSRAAGFDYHLVKPADLEVLRSLLRSLDGEGPAAERVVEALRTH
jgi:signal transduction histidine kinase/ActR/RegA family two-component response regulator